MFIARAIRNVRRGFERLLRLQLLLAAALSLTAAWVLAATPTIDSIVVKLRDGVVVDASAGLPANERAALDAALQVPFSHVGYTRNGALKLQLQRPLPLDAARAAINRVRMLSKVLYAKGVPTTPAASANAQVAQTTAAQQQPVRRLIVKFRDPATSAAARRNEALASAHVNRVSALAGQPVAHERAMSGGAYVVRLFQPLPAEQARLLAALLATHPTVEYAEPDQLMQPMLAPDDPSYSSQWHFMSPPVEMGGANLPPAWDITTGATGIVIAVIDTGVLSAHPDLAGRFIGGYDFISDPTTSNDGDARDADPSDPGSWCGASVSSFHGSHVAGTIGAATSNGTGVAGINWVSKILPVRVLGACGGDLSDIVDAIRWSVGDSVPSVPDNANPARVLNLSLGGYVDDGCGAATQDAIDVALAAGAVVVVSAGNNDSNASDQSPANCDGVITVGATGRAGQRASYSNYGALVEISAPGGSDGEGVLSTVNDSATAPALGSYTYGYKQGTSMAAPHVAGIASLMLSRNPSLTPAQVLSKIETSARAFPTGTVRNCSTALCGAGIIDAAAAVAAAGQAGAPTANFSFTASGLTANFTDSSTDSDGTIASRSWSFGDATTSTETNPSKTYAAAGTYSVTLAVTDNAGATNSVTKSVTVGAVPLPSNTLTNGVPVSGLSGSTATELRYTLAVPAGVTGLTFKISGGSGDADLYVRFGSAPTTTSYDCRPYLSGNSETCTIATAQTGTYHVMVRGYAAFSGVILTASYNTGSANVPPTANFSFTTSGLTANFTDSSTDSDGTIASRSWSFGDATTSTATNPSKTYTAAGTYSVTLAVTDNAGATNSVTKSVTVGAVPLPSNTLTNGVPVSGLSGSTATELRYTLAVPAGVTGLTFKISGGSGDADLYVRFGSAPTTTSYDCRPYLSGNSETCTIATAQTGTYHVMVRGYAAFSGVILTASYNTGSANVPPTANFSFTTSGLTANFTDSSTDSDGTIASRSWSFGDATTSTATNPSKTYTAAGTYSVTLAVTDNAGATNSVTKSVTVGAVPLPSNTLTNGVPVSGLSGSTATELRYTLAVPAGVTGLTFKISGGSGDADLYVRFGSAPTTTSYDCRPYLSGNSETCTIATAQTGTYHVMVRGYTSFSGVTLTGKY